MDPTTPSADQFRLASLLGVDISDDSYDVAAARLLDAVATSVGFEDSTASSDRQVEFAASLGLDVSSDTKRVASAKISCSLHRRNVEQAAQLNLKPGDRVIRIDKVEIDGVWQAIEQEFVVSSVQANGRIFFKGGNGQGAWPSQVRKVSA